MQLTASRPSLRQFQLICVVLGTGGIAVSILFGWSPILITLGTGLIGAAVGPTLHHVTSKHTRRRQQRAQAARRLALSDFDLALFALVVGDPSGALESELIQDLDCALEELDAAGLRLEKAGLVYHVEGPIDGAPDGLYYFLGHDSADWLADELKHRNELLEQAVPAPGPRIRTSDLAD